MSTQQQAPVWARSEVFPNKPTTGAFGFQDTKGKRTSAASLNDLTKAIKDSKRSVDLVWTPQSEHMLVPEEVKNLRPLLLKRRATWAQNDIADGKRFSLIIGGALLWSVYAAWANSQGNWQVVINTPTVAMAAIMLVILGLVPWYEGWKELRNRTRSSDDYWDKEIADARFDVWLQRQASPFTFILLALLVVTAIAQWKSSGSVDWAAKAVDSVGLLKQNAQGGDPWWRYLTAPMAHGNLVHWLMNFAALRYLAKRTESLARWPQMVLVFLISAFAGGIATVYWAPGVPSVGASGGILGLLGFLLVFETLHKKLVPRTARKRLVAGLVVIGLMGVLGFSFIDNAAHAGGLIAGMIYAAVVFPSSSSVVRPEVLKRDLVAGGFALCVVVAAAIGCALLVLG